MITKAFVLAAGEGTRLRPITDEIPKCLVPIQGVPLLAIWLRSCREAGITDVLINIHAHPDRVRRFLAREDFGVNVRVIEEESLLGSAGTLRANREWIAPEESFWVFYADVLNRADLASMARFHEQRCPAATLGVYEVPDPRRCGIVSTRADGTIDQFVEKPENPPGNLAFAGLMIASLPVLDMIPDCVPADLGFHVFPKLGGRMLAFPIREYLIDIGTPENYEKAQATWPGCAA